MTPLMKSIDQVTKCKTCMIIKLIATIKSMVLLYKMCGIWQCISLGVQHAVFIEDTVVGLRTQ